MPKITTNSALSTSRAAVALLLFVCCSLISPLGAAERGTNLVPGDRITVTVFGQPDLSGNFQVDGTGFIDLPLIGPVMVKQLTPKECEKVIEGWLADGYLNRPVVSVSIGEVRPVYVLGDVKSPGAYAFRHGSSVLSAIAQAGGYGAEVGGTLSDFLLADERVRMLEGTRRMLLIRLARLEAQHQGKLTFTPPDFVSSDPDGKLAEAVANEFDAMRVQAAALDGELKLQREQRPRLEAAHTSIEQQIQSEKKQFALVQDQLTDLEQLQSKGLSLRSREVALQREQAALDSNMSRYRSELARLAVTIGELDIKINDSINTYKRRLLTELDEVRRKIQEIETSMPTAREVRDVRSQQVANASGIGQAAPTYRIQLSRTAGDAVHTQIVTGETMLQPGDVVEVKRLRLEALPSAAANASVSGPATAPGTGNAVSSAPVNGIGSSGIDGNAAPLSTADGEPTVSEGRTDAARGGAPAAGDSRSSAQDGNGRSKVPAPVRSQRRSLADGAEQARERSR